MKRITVFGLAIAVAGCLAVPALAADDSYTYKIRIFPASREYIMDRM